MYDNIFSILQDVDETSGVVIVDQASKEAHHIFLQYLSENCCRDALVIYIEHCMPHKCV